MLDLSEVFPPRPVFQQKTQARQKMDGCACSGL
jgi:hypothetical protein